MRNVVGWTAVAVATAFLVTWMIWGVLENFHEGWHHRSLVRNLSWMFGRYLSVAFGFMVVSMVAIRWPDAGAALTVAAAVFGIYWFGARPTAVLFIGTPLLVLSLLFWYGRPEPRAVAYWVVTALPLAVAILAGIGPAYRVTHRFYDGDLGARIVKGNGVALMWAPQGPGWPEEGLSWEDAMRRCEYLSDDGKTLAESPQHIWRLPTAEELVCSLVKRGENSGGTWDPTNRVASYLQTPDKESPLWDPYSRVVYWWTATSIDGSSAYRISYNGRVLPTPKKVRWGYLGMRCVKEMDR